MIFIFTYGHVVGMVSRLVYHDKFLSTKVLPERPVVRSCTISQKRGIGVNVVVACPSLNGGHGYFHIMM